MFFNYTNQGNIQLTNKDSLVDPVMDVTNSTLFPQHISNPTLRNGGERWIPIQNKHIPLIKVMPTMNEIDKFSKISKLWFFCASFTVDPETDEFTTETMMSFTTGEKGVINTAFSEDRMSMSDNWAAELLPLVPFDQAYGNIDDDDDTAAFYLLDKFKPHELLTGENASGNMALRSKTTNRRTDKVMLANEGFHNTLLTATIDENDPPDIYKWTVKSVENPAQPDPNVDGVWNCDTN